MTTFKQNNSNGKKKDNGNQFVASLNSRKSDKPTAWVNLIESFAFKVFDDVTDLKQITAKEVQEKLSHYYNNEYVYLHVIDRTEAPIIITPEEY